MASQSNVNTSKRGFDHINPFVWLFGFLSLNISSALYFDFSLQQIAFFGPVTAIILLVSYQCIGLFGRRLNRQQSQDLQVMLDLAAHPQFLVKENGTVLLRNRAAKEAGWAGENLRTELRKQVLNSEEAFDRLIEAASFEGESKERVITRNTKLTIQVTQLGMGRFIYALESSPHSADRRSDDFELPMVTAASNGTILFMNAAARQFLGTRHTHLDEVIDPRATMSDVNLVEIDGKPKPCFLMQNQLSGGRREIFLIPALGKSVVGQELSYEDMPVAVLKIDESGKILASNKTAREMMGPETVGKHHLSDVMEGLGRPLTDWLSEAAQGSSQNLNEFLRIKRDDREKFVQVTLGRAFNNGEMHLYVIFHDATELKTLETQFVQSQKMQAIGQLAGGIAHDFNNLLTAISGHCDLLLLKQDQDDPAFADLMQIHQNANRAAALVSQLLAFSRKQTLQPSTVDLRECLSSLSHLLKRLIGDDITLKVARSDELHSAYLDPQQFEQVVINLVVNARDAMPNGGDVWLTAQNLHIDRAMEREKATIPPGDYVQIQVKDQGSGIEEARKEKVFEPFFTTKRTGEGTGLGLSTAYGIVKQSGGFIFLESEVGKGTTFTLLFPKVAKQSPVFIRSPQKPGIDQQCSGTVLLVEDEAPVRAFASRALRLKGFSVLEAASGEEALDILEDEHLNVDLFLTDVAMPGMDGPTWVRKAFQNREPRRVIFMSGYAEEKFSDQSSTIENAVFLPKPFSLENLTSTVRQQLSADALV